SCRIARTSRATGCPCRPADPERALRASSGTRAPRGARAASDDRQRCAPWAARLWRGRRARQLEPREKERDLRASRLGGVGAGRCVLLDVGAELAAHRALRRLLRIGRAHEVAPALDCVVALEDADEDRARRHELLEIAEEGTLLVDGVEAAGLLVGELRDPAG